MPDRALPRPSAAWALSLGGLLCGLLCALLCALLAAPGAIAQEFGNDDCAMCHSGSGGDPVEVDDAHLAGSVHAGFGCVDCHGGIDELPHAEQLPKVDCGQCHAEEKAVYTQHGRGKVGVSDAIPSCAGCHGTHRILHSTDKNSTVHVRHLPATCGSCHEDSTLIRDRNIKFKHPIRVYSASVHGRVTAKGTHMAASCNDCHSSGTAHQILPAGDTRSTVNYFNIPNTCGRCHGAIAQDYWEGIHGQLTADGKVDSPTCTHCHGEHGILSVRDPRSRVSPYRLAEATCSPCHDSAALNEKYDLPTGRLKSFVDSYHGLKSRAGDRSVANCASCHGAHRILASSDPTSSIHPNNLQHTCGECHPGISASMATTPIHATATGHDTGWPRFFRIVYLVLITVVIGGMVLHWLIDLIRQIVNVTREKQVRRMDPDEVVQHTVLAIAFTVLVITGFSLRFYDSWWSRLLFGREGGYAVRGTIHRVAGVMLLLASFWHLGYLLTARGRAFLRDIKPSRLDFRQFFQMMSYNLGKSDHHPQMGRFSYVEKAEYWALVWGTVVMGITGLFLWFDNQAVRLFTKGFLDVMLVIHYYEAWLAFLAILIWHMYATVFNPKVYPMNPSWLTGKMPERMFKEEHPAALAAANVDEVLRRDISDT